MLAMLLCVATLMMASCDNNHDENNYDENNQEREMSNSSTEGVVYEGRTPDAIQSSPLSLFMSKELHSPCWDGYGNKYYTFFDYDEEKGNTSYFEDKCIVINSMQEFQQAYHGTETLPDIDFTNNTLLICKTSCADTSSEKLGEVSLNDQGSQYVLLYKILKYNVCDSMCESAPIYYWRLCPKLQNKPVVMMRININVDD